MVCLGGTDYIWEIYKLSTQVLSFKMLEEESGDPRSPDSIYDLNNFNPSNGWPNIPVSIQTRDWNWRCDP